MTNCQTSSIRFDAIVSADAFEKLKPAPDIFLAASKILEVPTSEVYWHILNYLMQSVLVMNFTFDFFSRMICLILVSFL